MCLLFYQSFSIIIVLISGYLVESAKILGVFQFPSISHQIIYQTLWRELSLRGHQVTVVTPNPLNNSQLINLTEIDVGYIYHLLPPGEAIEKTFSKKVSTIAMMRSFYRMSEIYQETIMQNEQFASLYSGNPKGKFDLILVELLHPGMYSLSYAFDAPIIGMSSLGAIVATHESLGNYNHPVLFPEMNVPYHESEMSIWKKIYSVYISLRLPYIYKHEVMNKADEIARKYLGNDMPYLGNLAGNVDLLFMNTNPITHKNRPTVPNIIPLGFMHIQPLKPLADDLKKILDEATQGVVYFSLGSNVKSTNIDKQLQHAIVSGMAELPYLILWKWESDHFPNKPPNVITRKWLPQQDVLSHPNIKVFVTQGGLQSSEEAISRGVPIVGVPFIGDQPMNVQNLVEAGVALSLDPVMLTKEAFKKTVIEVAENPKYRNRMREVNQQVLDQPMTSLERAVWWTEYVIRHKGAKHLRSPTADISWYQFLLLDFVATVTVIAMGISIVLFKVIKKMIY